MYQSIVLSPTALSCLETMGAADIFKVISYLLTERLHIDCERKLLSEYQLTLEDFKEQKNLRFLAESFLPALISNGNIKIEHEVTVLSRSPTTFPHLKSELTVAKANPWKIIVMGSLGREVSLRTMLAHNVESLSVKEYLNPARDSRLRAVGVIKVEKGEQFDFRLWVKKFLKDAREIHIEDPYLWRPRLFTDLMEMLRGVSDKGAEISVRTLSPNSSKRDHYGSVQEAV